MTRLTRTAALGVLGALVMPLAAACGSSGSSTGGAGGCSGSGDVVIGIIAPTSGSVGDLGKAFVQGANTAAGAVNGSGGVCGGRHLRIEAKDDQNDVTRDQDLSKQLVEQRGAVAVILVSDTSADVAGPYLQQNGVLTVGAFTTPKYDSGPNAHLTFSTAIPGEIEKGIWKSYLLGRKGVRRPATVYETTTAYGSSQNRLFCQLAQQDGTPCVDQQRTGLTDTDVTNQVRSILGHGADGIFVEGFGGPVVQTVATARGGGFGGPIMGTGTTATTATAFPLLGSAAQGFVYVNYTTGTSGNPAAATQFAQRVKADAGGVITEPLFIYFYSYDAVQILASGWRSSGSLDPDAASRAIEGIDVKLGQGPFVSHDMRFSASSHQSHVTGFFDICDGATKLDDNGMAQPAADAAGLTA